MNWLMVGLVLMLVCLCLLRAGMSLRWLAYVIAVSLTISSIQHQIAKRSIVEGFSDYADLSESVLDRGLDESVHSWAFRLNRSIYEGTAHCDPSEFDMTWLEAALAWLIDDELFDHGILLRERFACGFCHQRAYLLSEQLRTQGVETKLLGLVGHVVATFSDGVQTYVVDPDYGVGPFVFDDTSRDSAFRTVQSAYDSYDTDVRTLLSGLYVSLENNGSYKSNEYLDRIRDRQRRFFPYAENLSWLLLMLSALLVAGTAAWPVFSRRLVAG